MSFEKTEAKELLSRLDIRVELIEEIDDGSETLFHLQTSEGDNLVAKFRTLESLDRSWFEKEPLLLKKLESETQCPIPHVCGYENSAETPYFVMDEVQGTLFHEAENQIPDEQILEMIKYLGKQLASIHSAEFKFTGEFGWIVNMDDTLKLKTEENWSNMFESIMSNRMQSLEDTQFSRYISDVEEFFNNQRHVLETVNQAKLIHNDFRPGNIIVDDTEVAAVLDWAHAAVADPEYDLINSMYHFTEELSIENSKIDESFISGYTSSRELSKEFEDKKDLYRICCIISKMTRFAKIRGEDYPKEKRDKISGRLEEELKNII